MHTAAIVPPGQIRGLALERKSFIAVSSRHSREEREDLDNVVPPGCKSAVLTEKKAFNRQLQKETAFPGDQV